MSDEPKRRYDLMAALLQQNGDAPPDLMSGRRSIFNASDPVSANVYDRRGDWPSSEERVAQLYAGTRAYNDRADRVSQISPLAGIPNLRDALMQGNPNPPQWHGPELADVMGENRQKFIDQNPRPSMLQILADRLQGKVKFPW